jgi:SDR family mycofactocin-dependent oxidoreductase
MMAHMAGKVALITGAARGQGRSHAIRMAEEGADIIAIDLCAQIDTVPYPMATPEDLAETARLVEQLDRRVVTYVADVRERAHLKDVVAQGVEALGHLDVVVANAGIVSMGHDLPLTAFMDALTVDMCGVVHTVDSALPHLGPGASIVCTGSMAAYLSGSVDVAGPGGAGYAHAKREVARFVHDLASVLAPHNIRVNAVHPGSVATDMLLNEASYRQFRPDLDAPTREDADDSFGSLHRMPVNTLDARDISEAVLYLASDASRYITGLQLKIDAGGLLPVTTTGMPDVNK